MSDLPSSLLAPFQSAAEMLKCLHEKALNVTRLEPLCFGTLHREAKFFDPSLWHGVVGQCTALQELEKVVLVDCAIDPLE